RQPARQCARHDAASGKSCRRHHGLHRRSRPVRRAGGASRACGVTAASSREKRPMQSNQVEITPELVANHGLKPDEYERILELIGRVPSFTELNLLGDVERALL